MTNAPWRRLADGLCGGGGLVSVELYRAPRTSSARPLEYELITHLPNPK